MLQRDKYIEDSVFRYFPNFSQEKYQQHIVSQYKPFYKLAFNEQQAQRWSSRINFTNNAVTGVFTLMLIPVIFFRKFPLLKRFTSKKGRFFWSLGLIFVPTNLVNYYFTSKIAQQITMSYNLNLMDFMRYRQTGDITIMNPSLQFAQF